MEPIQLLRFFFIFAVLFWLTVFQFHRLLSISSFTRTFNIRGADDFVIVCSEKITLGEPFVCFMVQTPDHQAFDMDTGPFD